MRNVTSAVLAATLTLVGCGGATASPLLEEGLPPQEGGTMQDSTVPDVTQPRPDGSGKDSPAPDDAGEMDSPVDHVTPSDSNPPADSGDDVGTSLPPVFCGAPPDPLCSVPTHECCVDVPVKGDTTYQCLDTPDAAACEHTPVTCDQQADCPGAVCCGTKNTFQNGYLRVQCEATCDTESGNLVIFCGSDDSKRYDKCTGGALCQPSSLIPGYYVCSG